MIALWNRLDARSGELLGMPRAALLLALRLFVAWVFFKSGLLKAGSWEGTLSLFEDEYAVPLLAPASAAILATVAELVLPPLLAAGLFTRPVALGLFAVNAVALISYPDISPAGIKDHQLWGLGLAVLCFAGAGPLSLDRVLARRGA
jgi:putative oxidoreductase